MLTPPLRALAASAVLLAAGTWAGEPAHADTGGDGVPEGEEGQAPLAVEAARTGQLGTDLITRMRLHRRPADFRGRDLCLQVFRGWERTPRSSLCLVGTGRSLAVRRDRHDSAGRPAEGGRVPARIRSAGRALELRVRLDRAGLRPGGHRWRIVSEPEGPVGSAYPNRGDGLLRIHRPQPTGCVPSGPSRAYNGSRSRRRVALTFDDGPGPYTSRVLAILRAHRARATFFVVGQEVHGRARLLRRMAAEGHEIANHSYRHEHLPSAASLAATSRVVRRATGFRPCRFRPPGGFTGARLLGDVRRLGMTSVMWDVDPADYLAQAPATLARRVSSNVRPGSIVVLHDGGGNRSRTVAALPAILRGLRARRYRAVTVSELLGGAVRYGQ